MTREGPAVPTLDHLLLGCADLAAAMDWFATRSGVRPARGGEHVAWGTHNALVSLGPDGYLELLAPQPALGPYRFPIDVRTCHRPRLVTWAVAVRDLDAVLRRAADRGIATIGPIPGGRLRHDGGRLTWRTARAQVEPARPDLDVWPFIIEWGAGTPHPAIDAPQGCTRSSFALASPPASSPAGWLAALALSQSIGAGEPSLQATLTTPRGLLMLTS